MLGEGHSRHCHPALFVCLAGMGRGGRGGQGEEGGSETEERIERRLEKGKRDGEQRK